MSPALQHLSRRSQHDQRPRLGPLASPQPNASGNMPAIIAAVWSSKWDANDRCASYCAACHGVAPSRRCISQKLIYKIAFAMATPILMIAPWNDCRFKLSPVNRTSWSQTSKAAGTSRDRGQGQDQRMKIRGQQQKDHDDGQIKPKVNPRCSS